MLGAVAFQPLLPADSSVAPVWVSISMTSTSAPLTIAMQVWVGGTSRPSFQSPAPAIGVGVFARLCAKVGAPAHRAAAAICPAAPPRGKSPPSPADAKPQDLRGPKLFADLTRQQD